MTNENHVTINPISVTRQNANNWQPVVGHEGNSFLQHAVPEGSRDEIRDSAISILSKGIPPTRPSGQETGLVVGYVQSGKTMSFEAVAALARDNGFQMVIIIAGTSNPLLNQSTSRIREDLRLDEPNRMRSWIHFKNPELDDTTAQALRSAFEDWRDHETPEQFKMTVLVTILKHHQRLGKLNQLLARVSMENVPTLIIDDEADQASLNTEASQGDESTTYSRLMELRGSIPLHYYLQYTATPQAPLLVSIADTLSPNFVEVINPGSDYVGGRDFFAGNLDLTRTIPANEVPTNTNPLTEPPITLIHALRVFMVGVTAGLHTQGNRGNRSMLVHPSHRTASHREYGNWVRDAFETWRQILSLDDSDPDKEELIEELREAHSDLERTAGDTLPDFEKLTPNFRFAFRRTRVFEVNAREGRTPKVDWKSSYGWILVGGQAMDRGFTVEGLTVTYMPRGMGVGNADTVQQRARFFGYKRNYIGYCRVYLEQSTLDAFHRYVEHEEDVRKQLIQISNNGQKLNEWKRAFILETTLRPCRNSVLEFDYIRGRFSNSWVSPKVVASSDAALKNNQRVVASFLSSGVDFIPMPGHDDRTEIQRHLEASNLSLREVLETLIIPIRITGTRDSQRITGMLLQLSRAIERDPEEICTVYRMSGDRTRGRGVDENGVITQLFQGQYPVNPPARRGEVYPGDSAIKIENHVSVQIHTLNLTRDGNTIERQVPVLAVWIPSRLATSWVVQDQPAQ